MNSKVQANAHKVGHQATDGIKTILKFMKTWALPFSMLAGAAGYFIYTSIPGHEKANAFVSQSIAIIQPCLIFAMLFVTFCKVKITELKVTIWHAWLILIQVGFFTLFTFIAAFVSDPDIKAVVESAMLCLICPTATAAAVVTGRLGGNAAGLISYTILSNLAAAVAIPVLVPFCHPHEGATFISSLAMILAKVFPLLICPLLAAEFVRHLLPKFHQYITTFKSLAFDLWVIALALAIAVTTKSLVHTTVSLGCQIGIAVISLIACLFQFAIGKWIGSHYNETISAGQSLGQKNTVFAIWLGYTFLTPVTAIVGGFYSIWHNLINSWQLYEKDKENKRMMTEQK